LQVLQSLDGGVVSEILVREGESSKPEQILLRIDQTRFVSSVRESRVQYTALVAKAARLKALTEGKPIWSAGRGAQGRPEDGRRGAPALRIAPEELETTGRIARQQLTQRQQELVEVRAKYEQAARAYELTSKELSVTKPLINSGAVSEVELLRLERDVGRFRGERDMARRRSARIQAAISEANHKLEEVSWPSATRPARNWPKRWPSSTVFPKGSVGLVRQGDAFGAALAGQGNGQAPAGEHRRRCRSAGQGRGRNRAAGRQPAARSACSAARHRLPAPGTEGVVKFTAYDFSIYGGLEGKLEHIGADSVSTRKATPSTPSACAPTSRRWATTCRSFRA
jgi:adhesin transport system membrane fusion protein